MMETLLLQAKEEEDIRRAGQLLRQGGVVAIPTETVYGLAADATNPQAVQKIFEAKGRPQDNPLIVHIASLEELPALVRQGPPSNTASMRPFMSFITCSAVVGLGRPERLAEGAAKGTPAAWITWRAAKCWGMRMPTVSSPAEVSAGIFSLL